MIIVRVVPQLSIIRSVTINQHVDRNTEPYGDSSATSSFDVTLNFPQYSLKHRSALWGGERVIMRYSWVVLLSIIVLWFMMSIITAEPNSIQMYNGRLNMLLNFSRRQVNMGEQFVAAQFLESYYVIKVDETVNNLRA